jgi:hypothetical protein
VIELLLQAESELSVGLLDRAEALYQQVVGADPRNSIAVVGLARVALERSDEIGALTLARRALVIDSENSAAQRMVLRLEEVLRVRGVAVLPTVVAQTAALGEMTATPPVDPRVEPPRGPERPSRSYVDRLLRRRENPP